MSVAADFSARSDVTLQKYNNGNTLWVPFFILETKVVSVVSTVAERWS